MSQYQTLHQQSIDSPSDFWLNIAQDNHWYKKPTIGVDTTNAPFNQWFPDGEINACYNAIDVHCDTGRADQAAIIYDSPVTNAKRTITYKELRDDVARFAGGLKALGV